ncbi:MAG: hypothetical protein AAGA00_09940 [Pseudomonadota bacterium]
MNLFLILLISHAAASVVAAILAYRSNSSVREFCLLIRQQVNGAVKLGTVNDYEITIPHVLRTVVAPIAYYYCPVFLMFAGGLWILMSWMEV